jgi:thiamine biosynthesis lipoprotein
VTPTRRDLFRAGAAGLGAAALASSASASAPPAERSFHFDHVLGTSLDVWVVASASAAAVAESAALDEIERLRKVFSLHDPESELSRLNRASGPFTASSDLLAVFGEYERWHALTGGALNSQVGGLVRAWDAANGTEPDAAALARAAKRIQTVGWTVDGTRVTRTTDQPLNLNSVAKGFILQKAADAVKRMAPAGVFNLGGDMVVWGDCEWTLGVQNPFTPAENAPLLTRVRVKNAAVATSGGYMRTYTWNGQKHSHILDPRTGRPADGVAQATVIAEDATTANALATALCVLGTDGLKLTEAALLIDADGREHRAGAFVRYEWPVGDDKKTEEKRADEKKTEEKKADPWPEDYQVTLAFELPSPGGRARRPYVASGSRTRTARRCGLWRCGGTARSGCRP